jgi:large subunit ribosomal protein L29
VKAEAVRELGLDELRAKEKDLKEQLFRLRFQQALGQLENGMKIREARRDIARVKTILKQKAAIAPGS